MQWQDVRAVRALRGAHASAPRRCMPQCAHATRATPLRHVSHLLDRARALLRHVYGSRAVRVMRLRHFESERRELEEVGDALHETRCVGGEVVEIEQ